MEGSENQNRWIASTSWTVAVGSLRGSISVDSSIDDGDEEDVVVSPTSSQGLILSRPPPESDPVPCEITINFRKKCEVLRVYVRSTARVYEIYYAAENQGTNEYLCTVRCGAAAVEDAMSSTPCAGEASGPVEAQEKMVKNASTHSGDEDGWVEVRVPDCTQQENGTKSSLKKFDWFIGKNIPVYYEATAYISDATPCFSLTLRLLSLQVKEFVHVEEIYIYADPVEVEATETGRQQGSMGSLDASPLLSMLVPSLLQLSKAGVGRTQHKNVSDDDKEHKSQDGIRNATETMKSIGDAKSALQVKDSPIREDEMKPTEARDHNSHLDSSHQIPPPKQVPEISPNKVLEELVCRVERIECLLMRFEEKMINPLSCMESRLEKLEQKIDALDMKLQPDKPAACSSRIVAPEFSCSESASSSLYHDKDIKTHEDLPLDEVTAAVHASENLPGLAIKAPEFSNTENSIVGCDEDLVSDKEDSPVRKPLSINDALSSSLAAFISSTSISPDECHPSLKVEAPEFSISDGELDELLALSIDSNFFDDMEIPEIDEDGDVEPETSTHSTSESGDGEVQQNLELPENNVQETTSRCNCSCDHFFGERTEELDMSTHSNSETRDREVEQHSDHPDGEQQTKDVEKPMEVVLQPLKEMGFFLPLPDIKSSSVEDIFDVKFDHKLADDSKLFLEALLCDESAKEVSVAGVMEDATALVGDEVCNDGATLTDPFIEGMGDLIVENQSSSTLEGDVGLQIPMEDFPGIL
ncbi:hypothetical protein QJS10_CPB19g01077 [Acorus calamus]|uniref:Uncharacterized protein n=1 Tax=Acorus calamus TaxID=4465 RepID=A0AAV9CEW6_ACOCL|nr:hypothetical protein QJS10_CPB19g01077 [Acorus calamus]